MNFNTDAITKMVVDALVSQKRVSRVDDKTVTEDVKTILSAVDVVNSLDETAKSINGIPLDLAELPGWVKPFVYPSKVAILPSNFVVDLVNRPKVSQSAFDFDGVIRASRRIAGVMRAQDVQMVKVSTMRGDVQLLSAIVPAVDGKTRLANDTYVIPVDLVSAVKAVLGVDYLCEDADTAVEQFIKRSLTFVTKA